MSQSTKQHESSIPRIAGGVLLGYVALFAIVVVGLCVAYLILGEDRVFKPGVYASTVPWMVIDMVVVFGAAYIGGMIANRVSGGERAPTILAVIVLLLGFWIALPQLFAEPGVVASRSDGIGALEALQMARLPMWVSLMHPFIGAVAVIVGGQDMDVVAGAPSTPGSRA
ncbi:MAG TPA: hypothetical protein VNZ57_15600 [Longimicrobiales bacterium]|nr:hypothetical protein [Longimicrobiales bacterium]